MLEQLHFCFRRSCLSTHVAVAQPPGTSERELCTGVGNTQAHNWKIVEAPNPDLPWSLRVVLAGFDTATVSHLPSSATLHRHVSYGAPEAPVPVGPVVPPPGPGSVFAFVLGNAAYPGDLSLPDAASSATELGEALDSLGVRRTVAVSLSKEQLEEQWKEFVSALVPDCIVVVFYSGVVVQTSGVTSILPVDVDSANGGHMCLARLRLSCRRCSWLAT